MTQIIALSAEARDRAGKGTARATRRSGRVPAVIYGAKLPPVMISLDYFAFTHILHKPGFFTHLFDLTVDGVTHRVLPRDLQLHPVSDKPVHVDFLRVTDDTRITVKVPVEFVGQEKSPGLKRGGVLNIVEHEIELEVSAANIPEHVTIDVSSIDVGGAVHLSSVTLPEGAKAVESGEATIVTVVAPSGLKSEEAEA